MHSTALVLSGGLALGAYQAGALSVLLETIEPVAVSGASIGAFHAAIVAGTPPEKRLATLEHFWRQLTIGVGSLPFGGMFQALSQASSYANVLTARAFGNRGLFGPMMSGIVGGGTPAIHSAAEALPRIEALIDPDLLNAGDVRCCITATDIATGEAIVFDTAQGTRIDGQAIVASGALIPSLPAVQIGDRLLCDGGFSANLPLRPILGVPSPPHVTIAIDLFSPDVPPPQSLADCIARGTDLIYVAQTRTQIEALAREWEIEQRPGAALIHLAYRPSNEAEPEKAYDFSGDAIARRMAAGADDARRALDAIAVRKPAAAGVLDVIRISPSF